MTKYWIAGHVVAMEFLSEEACRTLAAYRYEGPQPAEKVFSVTEEALSAAEAEWLAIYRAEIEEFLLSRQFCLWLAGRDGLYLHASAVAYAGDAYLFTADSGTGKSTHARLWKQAFGAEAEILNDDKPFVCLREGQFFVYGSPWCGKEKLTRNRQMPLRGVCFLEQAARNEISRLSPARAVPLLLRQTLLPEDKSRADQMLTLLERLVNAVPLYRLRCNISEDAARLACQTMRPRREENS